MYGRGIRDRGLLPYLLIAPALAFYVLFAIVPIILTGVLSLFEWNGLMDPVWVGFDNFRDLIGDPKVRQAFTNSMWLVFFMCGLPVTIALILVAAITRTRIIGMSIFRLIFFIPYTLALAVVAIGWRWLYAPSGSLNGLLRAVGLEDWVRPWLGDFFWALPAIGLVGTWVMFGFAFVLLLAGAQHIPRELYDQTRIDGAGVVREFFSVTLPGVRYELAVAVIMTLIFALRTFDLVLMATRGGPGYATMTPALLMYFDVFQNGRVGMGAATAVLLTMAIFLPVTIVYRWFGREAD